MLGLKHAPLLAKESREREEAESTYMRRKRAWISGFFKNQNGNFWVQFTWLPWCKHKIRVALLCKSIVWLPGQERDVLYMFVQRLWKSISILQLPPHQKNPVYDCGMLCFFIQDSKHQEIAAQYCARVASRKKDAKLDIANGSSQDGFLEDTLFCSLLFTKRH